MSHPMLYIWQIEKIINETLHELRLNINCDFDNQLSVPMSYNISTKTIKFNYLQVNGYKSQIKVNETEENFVKILVYRMAGYYFEAKKVNLRKLMYGGEEEKEKFQMEIEENAWERGRKLVPEHLIDTYDRVRELDKQLLKNG